MQTCVEAERKKIMRDLRKVLKDFNRAGGGAFIDEDTNRAHLILPRIYRKIYSKTGCYDFVEIREGEEIDGEDKDIEIRYADGFGSRIKVE